MKFNLLRKSVLFGLILVPSLSMAAEEAVPLPDETETPADAVADEPIFGSQLMTVEERMQFRTQMQNATTAEEREQIRLQHHEQMLDRAKEQGVTLPETPMMMRQGMGPGKGAGMGMGKGSGSGQGSGGSNK